MTDLISRDAAIAAVNLAVWKSPIKAKISTIDASNDTAEALRALHTIDHAALDKMIAEAVKPYVEALENIAQEASVPIHTWQNGINFKRMYEGWRKIATERIDTARAILAASKKGGV